MRREIIASLLLGLLAALCIINLRVFSELEASVVEELGKSSQALSDGDTDTASEHFARADELWSSKEKYLSVILDSSVLQRTFDGFSQLSLALSVGEAEEARELCLCLVELLHEVSADQKPTLESIF